MENIKEIIGKNLAALRKSSKMTQQELAARLNYSDKAISRWEHAETLPDIETLCRESDVITIHCPLNDSTRHLIDKEKISLMKKNVIIVNEARGAVVNENDITEAILSGRIAGFGCDVYSKEPFGEDHPYTKIKDKKNVILTPHCAWGAYEARARCVEIITKNIASFLDGEKLNRVEI